jgi:hypothetical protein
MSYEIQNNNKEKILKVIEQRKNHSEYHQSLHQQIARKI